jgi:shikimate dehydrogenase
MSTGISIKGATRLYPIIGDPIAQVRSPEVFSARFAAAGVPAVCIPVHVPAERFDAIVPALLALGNVDGLIATVPFKPRMLPFADRLGRTAQTVGALNALRREADGSWTGDMFDGMGFVRGAQRKGEQLDGRHVAQFGAGGAGSAIACGLAEAGREIDRVIDQDSVKAEALVAKLARAFPECAVSVAREMPAAFDMVVNASPVGMKPDDGLPGAIGRLDPGTLVGDVVILPEQSPMIRHAIQCGCRYVDGREMMDGQVDALLAFFAAAGASPR